MLNKFTLYIKLHKVKIIIALVALFVVFIAWTINSTYTKYNINNYSILYKSYIDNKDKMSALDQLAELQASNTKYAILASFVGAKRAFMSNDYKNSQRLFEFIRKNSKKDSMWLAISTAYLAQVFWQQEKIDNAMNLLDQLPDYLSYYTATTKGDIYFSQQKLKQAKNQYKIALDLAIEANINTSLLKIKLSAL